MNWLIVSIVLNVILFVAFLHSDIGWAHALEGWREALDGWGRTHVALKNAADYVAELEGELNEKPHVVEGDEWKNG